VAGRSPIEQPLVWHTVEVTVPEAEVELISDHAWAHGADAIGEVEHQDGTMSLTISAPDAASAAAIAHAIGGRIVRVSDSSWLDAWRSTARPTLVGSLVVQPAWISTPPPVARHVVWLEPAHAFGDGSHPTTRACLAALQQFDLRGSSVLDLGCGSGVLAVAAALLGAASVLGVDIDVHARRTTEANAERNGVTAIVSVADELASADAARFDVVVANIGAGALIELAPTVTACARSGASACLAGVLVERGDETSAAWERLGWRVVRTEVDDPWVAITLQRSGAEQTTGQL
jgi:ribosomal protein L11 methyltransferase